MDAVGLFESTPLNAKSALLVAVPPSRRSCVVLPSNIAPLACTKLVFPETQDPVPVTIPLTTEAQESPAFVTPATKELPLETSISPLFCITNFGAPLLLAVKRSPEPDWSTITPALVVAPENEAIGVVPVLPRISKVANGDAVPKPTVPATPPKVSVVPFAVRLKLLVLLVVMTGFVPLKVNAVPFALSVAEASAAAPALLIVYVVPPPSAIPWEN